MMKIIDPHLHLFNLAEGNYLWLKPEKPPFWQKKSAICRDIHEQELQLTSPLELAGFVHIEAGFDNQAPWREIAWLESHCTQPFKSVAHLNLLLPEIDFLSGLSTLKQYQSVVGIRHIFDEQALSLIANPSVMKNLAHIDKAGLLFELQLSLTTSDIIAPLVALISSLPKLTWVINHAGFPDMDITNHQQWLLNIQQLSLFDNVMIKVSGGEMLLPTVKPSSYTVQIVNILLQHFSCNNVIIASNFPLVLFEQSYQAYWQQLIEQLKLSPALIDKLVYNNSQRIYQLN